MDTSDKSEIFRARHHRQKSGSPKYRGERSLTDAQAAQRQDKLFKILAQLVRKNPGLVTLEEAGNSATPRGTLVLAHVNLHTVRFKLKWKKDRYVGYFLDGAGKMSQAIVTIDTVPKARTFSEIFVSLVNLRARKWLQTKPLVSFDIVGI